MKYEMRVNASTSSTWAGNPTGPDAADVVKSCRRRALDPRNHRYSVSRHRRLRRKSREVQEKVRRRARSQTEVIATIGSKEGFSHLCLALLGRGHDRRRRPGVSNHIYAPAMAGANVIRVPLGTTRLFSIDRGRHRGLYRSPKLLILNYPQQPDGDDDRRNLGPRDRDVPAARRHDRLQISPTRNLLRRLQGRQLPGREGPRS